MLRTGVIALGRIYDYEDRVVFRHEQTLAKPKADRCNLLQATRTHSGQLFMIYEDAENEVENIVCAAVANREADECVVDEYGVENLLWRIDDAKIVERVVGAMRDKRLMIADGHHRYETAREYRDDCRTNSSDRNAPHEFVMMTLVNMNSPGLVVLPTHRVVFGVEGFDAEEVDARVAGILRAEAHRRQRRGDCWPSWRRWAGEALLSESSPRAAQHSGPPAARQGRRPARQM